MKCDLPILSVTNENLMGMSETLFKLDFMLGYRNMIINLYITICSVNNESEINVVRRINACKKIYLPLSLSILLWLMPFLILSQQSWSWYQLMQGFLGGWIPFHLLVNPSAAPHIRFKLLVKIDTLTLGIAYLIPLLIY